MNDEIHEWIARPVEAYEHWQITEATGSDHRAFSARSVVQHRAMFERFLRFLLLAHVTLATFGPEHVEGFFNEVDNRCGPGTTTRIRYLKLIDRVCRHLVIVGVRRSNPADEFVRRAQWPEDQAPPLYLSPGDDLRLQAYLGDIGGGEPIDIRNRAIVAVLLGVGLTANELRLTRVDALALQPPRPNVLIPKRGVRAERRVTLPEFTLVALAHWQRLRAGRPEDLLFPSPRSKALMTDELLGRIVRELLEAIDIRLPDMSPRVLRNTFARRLLIAGRTNEEVTQKLGLLSQRTVVRLRETMAAAEPLELA